MRTQTQTLLAAAVLLAGAAAPARGQDAAIDPRWIVYLGCWERVETAKSQVCIVPAAGASAVDLLTIVKGEITARERIVATGERLQTTGGDCAGWQSAEWSAHGQRLYLRSEDACENARGGTGVIAMSGNGQWLYVQGMTVGGQTGLRVQRYREVTGDILLPNDVADARLGFSATIKARAAAGAPLAIDDVVEASRHVDTAVLEAWLVERAEPFTLDAKRLIALADADVPPRVIDLMVALSYPKAFAINGRRATRNSYGLGTGPVSAIAPRDPLCSSFYLLQPYASYDCTGFGGMYRYGYGYGYGYGSGWYPGGYPVMIVYSGGGSSSRPHGRVVNGQGYAQGGNTGTAERLPTSRESSPGGASSPSSSSTSSSSEQRTAKPRPPQ